MSSGAFFAQKGLDYCSLIKLSSFEKCINKMLSLSVTFVTKYRNH